MIGMVRYYRVTLALPLAVTALAYPLGRAGFFPSQFSNIAWSSMLVGGLPYAALAAFMFFWIRGKSERAIHTVIYVSPFFMVLLLAVAVPIFLPVLRGAGATGRGVVDAYARHSIFTLVLGYLYVAAVQSAYLALKAMHRISDERRQ